MDYATVPTTVFTPLEYGCVGYTEEQAAAAPQSSRRSHTPYFTVLPASQAIAEFGEEGVEVYHQYFTPLEWRLVKPSGDRSCYAKLIVRRKEGDGGDGRVLGLHVCGPHAGEMTQVGRRPLLSHVLPQSSPREASHTFALASAEPCEMTPHSRRLSHFP